jgi:hypothetical protein
VSVRSLGGTEWRDAPEGIYESLVAVGLESLDLGERRGRSDAFMRSRARDDGP